MDVTASPFCYRRSIPWDQQTRFCLQLWSEQTARPLIPMPRVLGDLLNMEILEGRNPALFAQRGIVAGLSRRSAIEIIRELLSG